MSTEMPLNEFDNGIPEMEGQKVCCLFSSGSLLTVLALGTTLFLSVTFGSSSLTCGKLGFGVEVGAANLHACQDLLYPGAQRTCL
jgi:hypothetical protein